MSSDQQPFSKGTTSFSERYQVMTNGPTDGFWDWNVETNLVWRSEGLKVMIGYQTDESELSAEAWHNLIHPDDKEGVISGLQDAIKQGSEWAAAYRFRRVDGSTIRIYDRAYPVITHGKVVRVAGYMTHISEQMPLQSSQAERKMSVKQDSTWDITRRREQQKMLTLVDNSLNFMAIADLEGRLTYLNKAGRALVGMTEADINAGKTVADFYTPEQYTLIRDVAVPTLLSQGHWSGRVALKHSKTGENIPGYANGIRIDDPATGEPIGRGFTIRDLRPELAAQEAQRKLLTLVDNSIELMSILELDGRNSYINKAGMDILGFENEQQVQQTPISQLHAPEHFALVEQEVLPSVMTLGRWSGEMLVCHLKTGEIFPVFNNTIRIDDPDSGQPMAVGAVMRDVRPERAAKQALIDSEVRFRSMIMQAPVAIGLLRGTTLVIESANEAILTLWGKGPEIIGQPLLTALPELEGQAFIELLAGVYQSGIPYYGYDELAWLYRNGQLEAGYFNFVYAPLRESQGAISGITVVATEVTQQVQAKKELEESEKRFRHLILDAPMAMAVYTGADMQIQLANEAMLTLWGKDASVIGQTLRVALPELADQSFYRSLEEAYTSGVTYQTTEDRTDLVIDGQRQTFYFNFTYKPLRDATGQVYAILNMAADVTQQVKARQQLKETQESLSEAVNLAELAPWTANVLNGEIICSARIYGWLGVTEEITPGLISRCIHPTDRKRVDRLAREAMNAEAGGTLDLEYTVINQLTKQERILRTQARVFFTEQGFPHLVRGTSQDITAQRITEQALEQQVLLRTEELRKTNLQLKRSNQELEQYAYVASHDLQEPLRKIQLYASLLSERLQQDSHADALQQLMKVEKSASRMSVLIKNILDFSRINYESGYVSQVDLNEIISGVLTDFELLLQQKSAQVSCSNLIAISAIPLQMTQLFYNLISNSLKFTREGVPPVITISCRQLTDQDLTGYEKLNQQLPYCEITVSDNGIGFNPVFGEKIFGLFQRLHHRQHYAGTGIGLSLCQRIIFNHQGEIWAEGDEEKGAIFHILLPITR